MKQFEGRLFGGQLFRGRLFRGPALVPVRGGGHSYTRLPVSADLMQLQRQRLIEDDELIAAALLAAMPGLMRRH